MQLYKARAWQLRTPKVYRKAWRASWKHYFDLIDSETLEITSSDKKIPGRFDPPLNCHLSYFHFFSGITRFANFEVLMAFEGAKCISKS